MAEKEKSAAAQAVETGSAPAEQKMDADQVLVKCAWPIAKYTVVDDNGKEFTFTREGVKVSRAFAAKHENNRDQVALLVEEVK